MDYVNAPVGGGRAPDHPLKPLVARARPPPAPAPRAPRSACWTCCPPRVKSGIKPPAAAPDPRRRRPRLTVSQPAGVTAAPGMDILCHAPESHTAKPYTVLERKRPEQARAVLRLEPAGRHVSPSSPCACCPGPPAAAVPRRRRPQGPRGHGPGRDVRRASGFGNAGVHIPHANAYPIAGQVRDFHPDGLPGEDPWCRTAWPSR